MKAFAAHTHHQIDDVLEDLGQAQDGCQTSQTLESIKALDAKLAGAPMLVYGSVVLDGFGNVKKGLIFKSRIVYTASTDNKWPSHNVSGSFCEYALHSLSLFGCMTHWHVLLPFRESLERHQQLLLTPCWSWLAAYQAYDWEVRLGAGLQNAYIAQGDWRVTGASLGIWSDEQDQQSASPNIR